MGNSIKRESMRWPAVTTKSVFLMLAFCAVSTAVLAADESMSEAVARHSQRRLVAGKGGMHPKGKGMHGGHRGMRAWKPATTANSVPLGNRFNPAYNEWNTVKVPPSGLTMTYDGSSSRIYSWSSFGYGVYTATLKTPSGNTDGLIISFYLSSSTPYNGVSWEDANRDEIDFEWVGNNKTLVQTNYLVDGVGVNKHEYKVILPFDHSAAFHTYRIVYSPRAIEWQVDNMLVRRLRPSAATPLPKKAMYAYFSIWASWEVPSNEGLLNWAGRYSGQNAPYKYEVSNIYVPRA